jgi:hypothetical protein
VALRQGIKWRRGGRRLNTLGFGKEDRGERAGLCFDPLGVLRGGSCQRGGSKPDTCQLKQPQMRLGAASEQSRNMVPGVDGFAVGG